MAGLRLQVGATTLDLPWGYDWSSQTQIELGLVWEQMTSGLWRRWDTGSDRDRYTASLPWRVTEENAALVRALVQAAKGIPATLLPLEAGLEPFGPHIDYSEPISVRLSAYMPQGRAAASLDWSVTIQVALDPAPVVQGILSIPPPVWVPGDFIAIADVSPVIDPGWSVEEAALGYLALDKAPSAYQCSIRSLVKAESFSRVLACLLDGRGAAIAIPAAQNPWGPGIPGSLSGGDHAASPKAWSWSQYAPNLYELSLTAARIP